MCVFENNKGKRTEKDTIPWSPEPPGTPWVALVWGHGRGGRRPTESPTGLLDINKAEFINS